MRMARGYGDWAEVRREAEYLLDDVQRGEVALGDKVWRSAYFTPTADYKYITVARDGNMEIQARGLTRGEQIVAGHQSEWRVVEGA